MAYSGLGKASYRDGDYKEAMGLFKLGNNTDWYSRAYKEYRKTVVAKWFAPAAVAVAGAGGRHPGRREDTNQTENRQLEREEE